MYKICLVEDEKNLQELLKNYLEKENYEVFTFSSGEDAIDFIESNYNNINLYILDIMLEGVLTGFDIIKKIREKDENVPVIFSSARDESIDKIMGLELGSDDYIAKPYSPKELVLKVNNLIKRIYKNDFKKINYKDYEIDLEKRIVKLNNDIIDLTTLEFDLLIYFIKNKGKLLTR